MPIYEYWCEKCQLTFEIISPIVEEKLKEECPKCAAPCGKIPSTPFLLDGSMRKRILGKGRMPETMKRVMRGEDPMTRKKDDFDEV